MLTSRRLAPPADLVKCDLHGAGVVAALDEAAEANRAGDVRALADHDETGVGADLERLEAAELRACDFVGDLAVGDALNRCGESAGCAPARCRSIRGRVEVAGFGELLQQAAGGRRLLVVAAEGVGQAGIWVARKRRRERRVTSRRM